MANLTMAQRHNNMLNKTFDHYRNHQNSIPTGHLLNRFLELAEQKLSINKDEAMALHGHRTVMQWEQLLKLGWNK